MVTLFGSPMSLNDYATACLLELIVHADDLSVSTPTEMPEFLPEALDLVVVTLARIGVRQHGAGLVIRAFARPERKEASEAVFWSSLRALAWPAWFDLGG